ncbi:MAG: type II-A CRISPR-associated protein Csn2 [Bacilli bacterium]|jgi:CRISPR-associated protein Csn2|nr:type II-A CRISPR-associated protein Csn2 [Bacilli bacterium]
MKINFNVLDEPIEVKTLTSLIVNDKKVFNNIIQSLYSFNSEKNYFSILNDDYSLIKENELLLVTDILGYDFNSASLLKLLYNDLEVEFSNKIEVKDKIEKLLEEVTYLINNELIEYSIDLESDEITFLELFKALGIKVEVDSDTILERTIEIIQIFKYLNKKRILVLVNTSNYFSNEEFKVIEEYVELNNVIVLMIDNNEFDGVKKQYILDNDYYLSARIMI